MSQSSASSRRLSADKDCVVNDIIINSTSSYLVQDFIGKGCFGKVAKSVNLFTGKDVALKIITSEDSRASKRELKMLEAIRCLDPIKTNVVHFLETFEHRGLTCLAFEKLDRNLFQLLMDRHENPLSLNEIRPIAHQLLTAFDALKGIGVIHADLKLDNIMLVNHQNQPFRVKLIDFGLSLHTSEVRPGLKAQGIGYRAPEVILGLPFTEAIDMWSLGCVLAVLYLSCHLFGVLCEYQQMRNIVDVLGQPADHLLDAGSFTDKFFKLNRHYDYPKWWLKTPMEYKLTTGLEPKECERALNHLDEIVTIVPEIKECIELEDKRAFLSLLKCLLQTDHEQRISPDKALKHPFILMVHLQEELDTSMYVDDSYDKMDLSQSNDSDEELIFNTEPEEELKAGETPACLPADVAGSASPGSCEDTSDGATAKDASPEDRSAVSCCAAQEDSEEDKEELRSATDGSAVKEETAEVKRSSLRRIRKFFSRAIRTVFRIKKKS
ncbi:homeodomain-interacting protein kinase 1-like isoform X1 [Notolabrus celidotus]|uniref:homeodomain-interacting protein kinase 1-like isoform X1 n=1 Tax=Notolabrus celidotus TaxID=1203425 RepID=UPI00148F9825|nr:homeodomain-interacting protein kinase 1-like isoform X1 [Notolabrus celidotus]